MKYLLFNCAVFLALGYLILGGDPSQTVQHIQQKAASLQERVTENATPEITQSLPDVTDQIEEVTPQVMEAAKPALAPQPAQPISAPPIEVAKPVVNTIPSPAETTTSMAAMDQINDDVIERVEVAPLAAQPLADAKARSQSLREMAAEMEQMFAEKMTW